MSRKENDDFVATKAEKTFNDDGETIEVAEVIKIDDKLLLKKLQDSGGSIRKSKLKNKKMSDVLGKSKFNKYKKD
jgi:hypothetical protein